MIITEIYKPIIVIILLSGTSGIPSLEQSSLNLACIPLLPIEAIPLLECQSEQIDALILHVLK